MCNEIKSQSYLLKKTCNYLTREIQDGSKKLITKMTLSALAFLT
jgi:hypothetical protein